VEIFGFIADSERGPVCLFRVCRVVSESVIFKIARVCDNHRRSVFLVAGTGSLP
jgi:hypothetical protein